MTGADVAVSVTNVTARLACMADRHSGLVAFLSFVVDGRLRLSGITLRVTLAARPTLVFPARRTRHGRRRYFVAPISTAAREALEVAVMAALPREVLAAVAVAQAAARAAQRVPASRRRLRAAEGSAP